MPAQEKRTVKASADVGTAAATARREIAAKDRICILASIECREM
jgi:hypothetical protein